MKKQHHEKPALFQNSAATDSDDENETPEDQRFDELCTRLLRIDPPGDLVKKIMNQVANMPKSPPDDMMPVTSDEGLTVRHLNVPPS